MNEIAGQTPLELARELREWRMRLVQLATELDDLALKIEFHPEYGCYPPAVDEAEFVASTEKIFGTANQLS